MTLVLWKANRRGVHYLSRTPFVHWWPPANVGELCVCWCWGKRGAWIRAGDTNALRSLAQTLLLQGSAPRWQEQHWGAAATLPTAIWWVTFWSLGLITPGTPGQERCLFLPLSPWERKPQAQAGCTPACPACCGGWTGGLSSPVALNFSWRRQTSQLPASRGCGCSLSGVVPCPAGTCCHVLAWYQGLNEQEGAEGEANKHFSMPASCQRYRSRLSWFSVSASVFSATTSQSRVLHSSLFPFAIWGSRLDAAGWREDRGRAVLAAQHSTGGHWRETHTCPHLR